MAFVGRVYLLQVGPHSYVGSTLSTLEERLAKHLQKRDGRALTLALAEHGKEGASIELLEEGEFDTVGDLQLREGLWQMELQPGLNCTVAGATRVKRELERSARRGEWAYYWRTMAKARAGASQHIRQR